MKCSKRTIVFSVRLLLGVILGLCGLFSTPSIQAAIPQPNAEQFINALVDHGYPDIALFYLESIKTDGAIPAPLKEVYDMELGKLHMANSGIQPSQDLQLAEIDKSHESFAKFIKENPKHARVRECARQYATLMMARGVLYRELAEKTKTKKAQQKDDWLKISRDSFDSARKEFLANHERAKEVLKKLKAAKKESGDEWEDAVNDFLQAWLAVAGSYYETAQTYAKDSTEYKQNLESSVKEYNAIFEKYGAIEPPYKAGLYARLREGRIKMDQGVYDDPNKETKGAFNIFIETMSLENNSIFQPLREEALQYFLESAAKYKNDKKPELVAKQTDEGLKMFSEWYEKELTPAKRQAIQSLKMELAGCDLAATKLNSLPKEQLATPTNKKLLKNTLDILDFLVRTSVKEEAREIKGKLGKYEKPADTPLEQMKFAELLEQLGKKREVISDIQSEAQGQTDPEKQAQTQAKMLKAAADYMKVYEFAELRRPNDISGMPLKQLNGFRYLAVYMMFLQQNPYRSLVLADFVVQNYPTESTSETMANMEMTILRNLVKDNIQKMRKEGKTDKDIQASLSYELKKMVTLAKTIATRTKNKGPQDGDAAWSCVCDTYVDIGDTVHAEVALNFISPNSDQRASGEIRTGNSLWNSYLRGMRADLSKRPDQKTLAEYKVKSQKILQDGVDRMKSTLGKDEQPSSNLVFAAYTLASLKLNSGDAQGAIQLLNDPQFGPLTLVKNNSELVQKNNLDTNTLRTSLRALVAAQKLDDAQSIMDLLEKRVAQASQQTSEDGSKEKTSAEDELTKIYLQLGMELKENLEVLTKEDKKADAIQLAKGFEIFLERIANRSDATFGSMAWVAQTYQSLGESFAENATEMPDNAREYFDKAAAMYDKILQKIKENPSFVSSKSADMVIMVRSAKCLAASRQFEKAIQKMGTLLTKSPANIEIQADAARCYQQWAESLADPVKQAELYKKSLYGCGKDFLIVDQKDKKQNGKPAIWGWNSLANKMSQQISKGKAKDERVTSAFFEARLTIASINEKQAKDIQDKAKQLEKFKQAEKILVDTHRSYPTLNDEETFAQFNKKLVQIRNDIKTLDPETVVRGFSELDTARGFAAKEDYKEAVSRILEELKKPNARPSVIAEMQPELATFTAKLAAKTESDNPTIADKLYTVALDGNPKAVSENGRPLMIGWNGIVKSLTDEQGKPKKDCLVPYLQARLAIAEIAFNRGSLILQTESAAAKTEDAPEASENPTPEGATSQGEDSQGESEIKADASEADIPEDAAPETDAPESAPEVAPAQDAPAATSESTSDQQPSESTAPAAEEVPATEPSEEAPAEEAPAEEAPEATDSTQPEAAENAETTESADTPAEQAEASATAVSADMAPGTEAPQAEKSNIPPRAKAFFDEAKKILFDDYNTYQSKEGDNIILGNSDILASYEYLLKKVQTALEEPVCGYAPPESLLPKKEVVEEVKKEEPMSPAMLYSMIGGAAVIGLILVVIFMWPRKKQAVEREKLAVSSDGQTSFNPAEKKEAEKVNLGFAAQPEAKEKVDLGFAGFGGGEAAEKVDLGFGGPQTQETFSFDMTKKPAETTEQKPSAKPAPKPAPKQAAKPAAKPAASPAAKPAAKPVAKPTPEKESQPKE